MKVKVCVGTMCHLMGASEILTTIQEIAENNPDIEIVSVTCPGYCHIGKKPPIIEIDGQVYENVSVESVHHILKGADK
ncbi:MAG: NAD(P)H-dependent oxidoreductase subunit E [Thermotogaceae bacterium]|nr:NAD(P)H-dependent oxidoreductase subunit E [Thermotogaceae bacterium]